MKIQQLDTGPWTKTVRWSNPYKMKDEHDLIDWGKEPRDEDKRYWLNTGMLYKFNGNLMFRKTRDEHDE